ncbi:hypothetical protein BH09PSE4_BH09PSE4_10920 [soil metagenome]
MTLLRSLLTLMLLVTASAATAQTFPPLTGRVVDAAHLLSPEQVALLEQQSADIEKASTRQFVVATIPDLQGYPIEDYGYQLGRAWKIGQGEANNGILLIVAPNEKKVRIEVGYGLEPIMTDALSSTIIQNDILPKFRDGDMPAGIMAGANAIGEQMKLPPEAAEARAKTLVTQKRNKGSDNGALIGVFWLFVILFFVLPMIFRRAAGKKYRRGNWPVILWGPGFGGGGGSSWGSGGGSSWGGGGGGGFSGGGGSFGGGGASGGW